MRFEVGDGTGRVAAYVGLELALVAGAFAHSSS